MSHPSSVRAASPSFEAMAIPAMADLQASLAELVRTVPHPIRRAVDLERALGLEKKLAWQVFRLSRSSGLGEVANVPSLVAVNRLVEAARRHGLPEAASDAVLASFERFETFAINHCGDRAGLVSMVSGIAHEQNQHFEEKTRKALFRANAHVWGLQAELQVRTMIHTGERSTPHKERSTLVAADIGLQQLHAGRPLTVTMSLQWVGDATSKRIAEEAPHPGTLPGPEDLNLLADFCTQPLPQMIPQPTVGGRVEMELVLPATGRSGATTLYMLHDALRGDWAPEPHVTTRMFLSVPTPAAVVDVMVPAGWTDPTTPRALVYGRRHHPEHVVEEREIDLLPQRATFTHMGRLDTVPPVDGAPRHQDAVRHVLSRIGALGTRFDVYRCRVEYPVMHSLLVTRVDFKD